MSEPFIQANHLSKTFQTDFWKKPFQAVSDVSFDVNPGQILGVVGPNGAGKTTTIKMILGITRPSTGSVTLMGNPPSQSSTRHAIGYLPESAYYYDFLNPREVLQFYGRLFSISHDDLKKRIDYLLDLVGLSEKSHLKLKQFSKGMLQRLGVAQAMINDPKLLILDEPMSGLDPIGRKEVRDIILHLKSEGKTILFSSHILHDIETLCESIVMIFHGKVVAQGQMAQMLDQTVQKIEIQTLLNQEFEWPDDLKKHLDLRRSGNILDISVKKIDLLYEVISMLEKNKASLLSVQQHRGTLEDLFMNYVR